MELKVYNTQGEAVREVTLDPAIFNVPLKKELMQRAVLTQTSNARTAIAHTKTKAEVRGGGRKPWRQKGTGKARQGSIRSPQWVGGGIAFGPRSNRNFAMRLNKKESRKALFMSLSEKVRDHKLLLIEDLAFPEAKTKHVAQLLKKLPGVGTKKTLLVQATVHKDTYKSARNIPHVDTILANSLNLLDVLRHDVVIVPVAGLDVISKTFRH